MIDKQYYSLEIGKNIQIISGFKQAIKIISIATILFVLIMTILFDIGIFKYLLRPLNQVIIPKLKTTTTPESFDYSELKTSTTTGTAPAKVAKNTTTAKKTTAPVKKTTVLPAK
ncbi:MAG: hypothetical protein WC865_07645 [Bacteroidales bacterium]